jgi:hypothetical protein
MMQWLNLFYHTKERFGYQNQNYLYLPVVKNKGQKVAFMTLIYK